MGTRIHTLDTVSPWSLLLHHRYLHSNYSLQCPEWKTELNCAIQAGEELTWQSQCPELQTANKAEVILLVLFRKFTRRHAFLSFLPLFPLPPFSKLRHYLEQRIVSGWNLCKQSKLPEPLCSKGPSCKCPVSLVMWNVGGLY